MESVFWKLVVATFYINFAALDCANVVVFPLLTKSQLLSASRIADILADAGHAVTLVIPENDEVDITVKKPNFRLVTFPTDMTRDAEQEMRKQALTFTPSNILRGKVPASLPEIFGSRCRGFLLNEKILSEIDDLKPDLVIIHTMVSCVAAHFTRTGVPFLDFCSVPLFPFICGSAHRIPANPSYVPDLFFADDEMNFINRVANAILGQIASFAFPAFAMRKADVAVAEYQTRHGMPLEDITALRAKASFLLVHGDLTFESIRPSMPKVVYIGGVQCDEAKPLEGDLKDFVDGSGDRGIVVFSLGGALDTDALPHGFIESFFDIFRDLPQRVVWKLKKVPPHLLEKQPANVKLVSWMPQQDLLGHSKTKLFITHGGIQGSFESICHGKPVLGIGLFGDQVANLRILNKKGMALTVENYKDLDLVVVKGYISDLLNDPKYANKALMAQALFRDHPQTPAQRLQFAVGYALRHNGAHHLTSKAALKLYWFQYYLLDVVLFISFVGVSVLSVICFCCAKCWNCCCSKKAKKD